MASIATTREKSRARTSVTSQSTVWSIEAESGSGAVFRPERSFMMKAPKWVRFEDRHSILNSAIHPELGSSAAVTDPRHPYALTRLRTEPPVSPQTLYVSGPLDRGSSCMCVPAAPGHADAARPLRNMSYYSTNLFYK